MSFAEQLASGRRATGALDAFGGGRVARQRRRRRRRLAGAGVCLSALFALMVVVGMPAALAREVSSGEEPGSSAMPGSHDSSQRDPLAAAVQQLQPGQQEALDEASELLTATAGEPHGPDGIDNGRLHQQAKPAPKRRQGGPGGAVPWLLRPEPDQDEREWTHPGVDDPGDGADPTSGDPEQPIGTQLGWTGLPGGQISQAGGLIPVGFSESPSGTGPWVGAQASPEQQAGRTSTIQVTADPSGIAELADRPLVTQNGNEVVGPVHPDSLLTLQQGQQLKVVASPTVKSWGAEWAFDSWIIESAATPAQPETYQHEPALTVDANASSVLARYRVTSPAGTPVQGLVLTMAWRGHLQQGSNFAAPVTISVPGHPETVQHFNNGQSASTWTLPLDAQAQVTAPHTVIVQLEGTDWWSRLFPPTEVYSLSSWNLSPGDDGRYIENVPDAPGSDSSTILIAVIPGETVQLNYARSERKGGGFLQWLREH